MTPSDFCSWAVGAKALRDIASGAGDVKLTITQGVLGSPVGSAVVCSMFVGQVGWILAIQIHDVYAATASPRNEDNIDATR